MNNYEGKEIQVRVICLVLGLNLQALLGTEKEIYHFFKNKPQIEG